MSFNSILLVVVCFTCAAVFNPLTVHGLHQEMDSGFNPIATVDLASQDFAVDYYNHYDNEVENNEGEEDDIDENRSLRGDRIKVAATNPIAYRGGPVMTTPTPVYLLWYGTWTASQMQIVNDFLASVRYTLKQIHSYRYTIYTDHYILYLYYITITVNLVH